MKIGINTNVFIDYEVTSFLEDIKDMGYQGIEIARTHALHEKSEKEINEIKEMLKKIGLEVYCIQGALPQTELDYGKKRIDLAATLGAKYVNIGPGIRVKKYSRDTEDWKRTVEIFSELCEYAGSRKVSVAIEPEPIPPLSANQFLLSTYKDVINMIRQLPFDNLGAVLDIAHVHVTHENFSEIIKNLKEKIALVHVSDVVDNRHYHFIPGSGSIDFEAVFKILHKFHFEGFLSVEIYPYFDKPREAASQSIIFLSNLLYKLGLI